MDGAYSVSKGEFARRLNVSAGRVSQYISEGKLKGAALEGEGRSARIVLAEALRQLNRSLDVGQMIGNGIDTRLTPPAQSPRPPPEPASSADLLSEQIKIEKLKEIQSRNRRQEIEDRAARGEYTRTAEVRDGMRKVAGRVLTIVEGSLAEMAAEIASQFKIPQRDVLHILRLEMRQVRSKGEAEAARGAAELPAHDEDAVAEKSS